MAAGPNKRAAKDGPKDEWLTPVEDLIRPLDALGGVGFDPCGNPRNLFARQSVLLPGVYDSFLPGIDPSRIIVADGLEVCWDGRGLVYVNGPWSDLAPWSEKAAEEGDEVILHIPARMNVNWLHDNVLPVADAIFIPRARVHHRSHLNPKKRGSPYFVVLFYFGHRPELFLQAYAHLGYGFLLYR